MPVAPFHSYSYCIQLVIETKGERIVVDSSPTIFVCSDAIGETAEAVTKATIRQFASEQVRIKRYGYIKTKEEISFIVNEASDHKGFIAYTLVQPELREMMKEEAILRGVRAVDVMGPMMQAYTDTFNDSPKRQPGLLHELDADYFRMIEAIEFAVKYDDGKDVNGILQAQIVLVGVSRTSKTPLSIFLAHKGIKTANYPIIPELKPPAELCSTQNRLIIGVTMTAEHLLKVRTERLRSMGLPQTAKYATLQRIQEELTYAHDFMNRNHYPIIDVTEKAIEETAGIIMSYMSGD
jgi:regulator of PEP synthase PpsR (kinase-PPPase family)